MKPPYREICSRIDDAERIVILSHDRPDGDAVGSTLALGLVLEEIGKEVVMVNRDDVPEALRFLAGSDRIQQPGDKFEADLVIALDAAERKRIDNSVWESCPDQVPLIVIDHHVSNPGYGDIDWIDPHSPATGQLVFQLMEEAGWEVSSEAAAALYAAISTDTGSFRYPSTTAETMRIGGELIQCGIDVGWINQMLYEQQPRRRIDVLCRLLEVLRIENDGRSASVALPMEWTRELDLKPGDTEGAVDLIRSIDSVVIAVLFEELPDGRIRVSSRSKDPHYGVGAICARFGGGGHTLAAGARLPGPLGEAQDRFLEAVSEAFEAN